MALKEAKAEAERLCGPMGKPAFLVTDNGWSFVARGTLTSVRRIAIVPELAEILRRLKQTNRKSNWVFETKRGTRLHPCNVQKRFREICDGLGFNKRFTVH